MRLHIQMKLNLSKRSASSLRFSAVGLRAFPLPGTIFRPRIAKNPTANLFPVLLPDGKEEEGDVEQLDVVPNLVGSIPTKTD